MIDAIMMIDEVLIVEEIVEIEIGTIVREGEVTIVSMTEIDKVDDMVEMMIEIAQMTDTVVVGRMKIIETLDLVEGQEDLTQMIPQN